MKYNFFKGVIASLALAISGFANAGLIVDQSFDSSNIIGGANFSQGSSSIFDDFSLSNAANLEQISMWGGYWTTGVQPSSFDFRIQIRSSTNVSDVIYDTLITASNVTDTGFNHNNSSSADILKFDFDVTGLSLNVGSYFIGVSSQNNPGTSFYWQRSDNSSFNGGIASFSSNLPTGSSGNHTLAISESSAQVPEPSTLAIFALGMIGLASRRFKKQS